VLSGANLSNKARVPVTLCYCRAADKFVPLNPALRAEPLSKSALALPANADLQKVIVRQFSTKWVLDSYPNNSI
jgi:hypothetical protein